MTTRDDEILPTIADSDLPQHYRQELDRRKAAEARVDELEARLAKIEDVDPFNPLFENFDAVKRNAEEYAWYGAQAVVDAWDQSMGEALLEGEKGNWSLRLVTMGWSENEDVVDRIPAIWHIMYWQKSERGGLHVYAHRTREAVEEAAPLKRVIVHRYGCTLGEHEGDCDYSSQQAKIDMQQAETNAELVKKHLGVGDDDAYPDLETARQTLRAAGLDPDEVGRRGADLVRGLIGDRRRPVPTIEDYEYGIRDLMGRGYNLVSNSAQTGWRFVHRDRDLAYYEPGTYYETIEDAIRAAFPSWTPANWPSRRRGSGSPNFGDG
jgi:hypothetical protein